MRCHAENFKTEETQERRRIKVAFPACFAAGGLKTQTDHLNARATYMFNSRILSNKQPNIQRVCSRNREGQHASLFTIPDLPVLSVPKKRLVRAEPYMFSIKRTNNKEEDKHN